MRDVKDLAEALQQSLDSQTKEEEIAHCIIENDSDTRDEIAVYYKDNIDPKGLDEVIKTKFSGDFQHFCFNAFRSYVEYDCHQLNRALEKGIGFDEFTVYEIILTRPHWMLELINKSFYDLYKLDLAQCCEKISKKVSTAIRKIIETEPSENQDPDHKTAEENAKKLVKLKKDAWYDDQILNIFAKSSPEELVLMGRYFYKNNNKTLMKHFKDTMSDRHYEFFKTWLICKVCPAEFFADRLYESMKGIGTDNNMLERILLTRAEVDMDLIRKTYAEKYKKTLQDDIKSKCKGNYRDLALGLANKLEDAY